MWAPVQDTGGRGRLPEAVWEEGGGCPDLSGRRGRLPKALQEEGGREGGREGGWP